MFKKRKKRKGTGIPSKPVECMIINKQGLFYHPTKAPDGLSKCGVMLELQPKKTVYVFPSHVRAMHAKEHTIRFLKEKELPFDFDDFVIQDT